MTRTPRLRPDVAIVEQTYRGELSYVVKDLASQKYFRFRSVEITVMRALDGTRTCGEAAEALREAGIGVSEAAVEGFAQKLNRMGLMERSVGERSVLQLERLRAERKRRARPRLFKGELLRMRWSMGDPDALFNRWIPRLGFFYTRGFVIFSLALFAVNLVLMATNWDKLHTGFAQLTHLGSYTPGLAVLLWLTLMVIILIHELGHGITCKHYGGEVHEMGFMLLYFQPAFFANVNDAWTFPELRARLAVTAAGSWIEAIVASLAGIVWWLAEPGTMVSQLALFTFLVGGVVSALTNANPLMPLDGYFALSDWLEIPNMRHRAFDHLRWMVQRHLLRLEVAMPPASERERKVFLLYGIASFAYLIMVLTLVGSFVVTRAGRVFGFTGVVVALGGILLLLRGQIRSWAAAIGRSVREHREALLAKPLRFRVGAAVLAVLLALLFIPWSITVTGPFTAAPARATALVAPDSAYVASVMVREGTSVPAGAPLVRLRDFALERAAIAGRRSADSLAMLEARARAAGDAGEAERLARERAVAAAGLDAARARIAALALRAPEAGVVLTARPEWLSGQWVDAGQTVLTIGEPDSSEVRIRLNGSGSTLVAPGQRVTLLSLADVAHPVRGAITSVSRTAATGDVEARVHLPAGAAWRPGASGEASVVVRKSNLAGALWWAVRKRVRSDLLL